MLRPRLKPVNCVADGETLILSLDPRERIELADPTGHVRALLLVLAGGLYGRRRALRRPRGARAPRRPGRAR